MFVKSVALEQISNLTRNWEALKYNYGTCQEMPHYLVLSSDNAECADVFLLGEKPPASYNQKSNADCSRLRCRVIHCFLFHSRLYQCLSSSSLIKSASTPHQCDQGQISTPTFYLSRTTARKTPASHPIECHHPP